MCTLRAAIQEVNAPGGLDTISLPPGLYQLTLTGAGEDAAATGDLDITGNVTILGAGASSTVINAGALGDRIFQVLLQTSSLQISNVTLQNGSLASGDGGGIYNAGTLVLNDSLLQANAAQTGRGGGLFSVGGSSTTLNRVWVTGNTADSGGGIAAVGDASHTAILDVRASAVTTNTANNNGTALVADYSASNLTNVTVSNNVSGTVPAVLAGPSGGSLTLTNVTIVNNFVGLAISGGTVRVANSILADNSSANCSGTFISQGNNLDSGSSCGLTGTGGDRSNTNAGLDALGNYGGSTPTHRLQPASLARDTGGNGLCPFTDQRGISRPQNLVCDVGAVEYLSGPDGP
jgi:hypothetical protein